MKMDNYYIQIIFYKGDLVLDEKGPYSERKADKIDAGININLNHDEYYTKVVQL